MPVNKKYGFTLLEIIIIISIIGILMGIGVTRLPIGREHRQLSNAVDYFRASYYGAVDRAILSQNKIRIMTDDDFLLVQEYQKGLWNDLKLNKNTNRIKFTKEIRINLSNTILIYPSGRSSGFKLAFSNEKDSISIYGDTMGRIGIGSEKSN